VFKRLGIKQASEPAASVTFKRTIKGSSGIYYEPSILTEETSDFSKRIKLEETGMHYLSVRWFCNEVIVKDCVYLYIF